MVVLQNTTQPKKAKKLKKVFGTTFIKKENVVKKMRAKGAKGAPTAEAIKKSQA